MYEIEIYKTANGKEPYTEWLEGLDRAVRAKIKARVTWIRETGNLGVYEPLDGGVHEIKFYFGSGYRIYFGIEENTILLLLLGGDKGPKQRNIGKLIYPKRR